MYNNNMEILEKNIGGELWKRFYKMKIELK